MKSSYKKIIFACLFFFLQFSLLTFPILHVGAQEAPPEQNIWEGMRRMILPLGIVFGYQDGVPTDIRIIATMIIRVLVMVFVIIFVTLIIYGGYIWMMARGEEEEVRKAQGILRNGVVGIAIIFASYAITRFVLLSLVCAVSKYSQWCLFFAGIT